MPSETHYLDTNEDVPSLRPPYWYCNGGKTRCKCAVDLVLEQTHTGYSDYVYRQWICPLCKRVFVDYMEG